jgi:hypothetical protein
MLGDGNMTTCVLLLLLSRWQTCNVATFQMHQDLSAAMQWLSGRLDSTRIAAAHASTAPS